MTHTHIQFVSGSKTYLESTRNPAMESKLCTGPCGCVKPLEAFGKYKRAKDGRASKCKECYSEYMRERRKNPEVRAKHAARARERRKNPEVREREAANCREYMERKKRENPEWVAERAANANAKKRKRRREDPVWREEQYAQTKAWVDKQLKEDPNYRAIRRQQKTASQRKRREDPNVRAKEAERMREYSKRPEIRARAAAYIRKRRRENPKVCIKRRLRARLQAALKGTRKAASTKTLVGCTWEQLKMHIEAQFLPDMTWENQGEWEIDHKIPFAAFDLTVEENQFIVMWFPNLQPLWHPDNRRKRATYKKDDQLDLIRRYRAHVG